MKEVTLKDVQEPLRVIIVGAGSAGRLVAREIEKSADLNLRAVAFADDDPAKRGSVFEGVTVLASTLDIGRLAQETGAVMAILAMPSAPGAVVRAISSLCRSLQFPLRTVPSLSEILSGAVKVSALREIEVADLLRRSPTAIDPAAGQYLQGARVLVTGAGGSIGFELCRQVLMWEPEQLVLFEISEHALYEADRRLRAGNPQARIVSVLGNICEAAKVERVLRQFEPSVVFHAAAYKHIPLTEINEAEAVTNIVFGTRNVLRAALQSGVARLVVVSSDKAVQPLGVMGACKRMAELLVRDAARKTGRGVVAVRFGNVLASSGSVVPLFREQIAQGGPVTVGHPDLERYFMTLQEASSLVIAAGGLGQSGDTYVLDMGQPVRILTLAEDLIRLSGLEPGRDIEIIFTGLRAGEKMRESLFLPSERAERTRHPQILCAAGGPVEEGLSETFLAGLGRAAGEGADEVVRDLLRTMVPSLGSRIGMPAELSREAMPAGEPLESRP